MSISPGLPHQPPRCVLHHVGLSQLPPPEVAPSQADLTARGPRPTGRREADVLRDHARGRAPLKLGQRGDQQEGLFNRRFPGPTLEALLFRSGGGHPAAGRTPWEARRRVFNTDQHLVGAADVAHFTKLSLLTLN